MWKDPIVEEVRRIRDAHARDFNFDLHAIFEDLLARQEKSGRTYVRFEPRRPSAPSKRRAG
jgi:hypothetical protein